MCSILLNIILLYIWHFKLTGLAQPVLISMRIVSFHPRGATISHLFPCVFKGHKRRNWISLIWWIMTTNHHNEQLSTTPQCILWFHYTRVYVCNQYLTHNFHSWHYLNYMYYMLHHFVQMWLTMYYMFHHFILQTIILSSLNKLLFDYETTCRLHPIFIFPRQHDRE